ncbi:MAG: Bifunctional protein HldE [uncultured bacterium]|nr:MAG: Bifunctional protein HldE [uncultured bacterium]
MVGVDEITDANCDEIGKRLSIELNSNVIITRGKKGMKAYMKDDGTFEVPTKAEEVFDVTGAGDTVISTVALAYASGADVLESCQIANLAAHVVISKFGTETSTVDEISKLL